MPRVQGLLQGLFQRDSGFRVLEFRECRVWGLEHKVSRAGISPQ